jgi:beta-N-acetylhexosaminidase
VSLGPLLVDVEGLVLTAEDRELLMHPLVGGVILFARNYGGDRAQLEALVEAIHALRSPRLLVTVDHEGGRVQRFRDGFTVLPPARVFGQLYDRDPKQALALTELTSWLLAAELRAVGVDLSFAPVVDLDYGASSVIGDRALHSDPAAVSDLARSWVLGMRRAGMAACAKHFPGHGAVGGDSHLMLPVDSRPLETIRHKDMAPYQKLVNLDLPSVMMAHVVYGQVDPNPASLSRRWIHGELRINLRFDGAVFCDDLSMRGAEKAGDYLDRAKAALAAGCDMLPVCNNRAGVMTILDGLEDAPDPMRQWRLTRLHGRDSLPWDALVASSDWRDAQSALLMHLGAGFRLES